MSKNNIRAPHGLKHLRRNLAGESSLLFPETILRAKNSFWIFLNKPLKIYKWWTKYYVHSFYIFRAKQYLTYQGLRVEERAGIHFPVSYDNCLFHCYYAFTLHVLEA